MAGANGRRAGMGNPEPCPIKCQLLDAPGSIVPPRRLGTQRERALSRIGSLAVSPDRGPFAARRHSTVTAYRASQLVK